MVSRFLITTADERTWKFDRPVIFLGEWCRHYDRKHIWRDMDAIVAAPYGLGQAQKDMDHAEARALEEKLFPILCDALNQHHGTQHSPRFWRIVLGHWLRRYVDVIFNRVKTLEQCLQSHQLSGTTAFSDDRYALAPLDSYAAIWAFNDDRWNNKLYVRILSLLGVTSCPVEVIAGDESEGFRWHATVTTAPLKRRILKWGYQQVRKLARFLARENDVFIINSYLSKKEEIKLQLALGQVPQLWGSSILTNVIKPDRALRQSLSNQIAKKSSDTLSDILRAMVFELLPACYLEAFAELTEKVQQLPWPKKPKFIFTSNNFDTDEIFKVWTASKIQEGTKYYVGQHGNNYGVNKNEGNNTIEENTSDKFLTWGWLGELKQHTAAFMLKSVNAKNSSYNKNGTLLLVEVHLNHRMTTYDGMAEFDLYFEEQTAFVDRLNANIKNKLIVRLFSPWRYFSYCEDLRWKDIDPSINIEKGNCSMGSLIADSRLVVQSYDSTGMLETFSKNIPTIAFWQNHLDHLKNSAIPFYQSLIDVGIVHFTPESAAAKVNEVWDDVEGWWAQHAVQEARKQFCDRYARVSQNPVHDLKKLLTE